MHTTHDLTYAHAYGAWHERRSVRFSFILSSTHLVFFYVIFVAFISSSSGFNERPENLCARKCFRHTKACVNHYDGIDQSAKLYKSSVGGEWILSNQIVNMCSELSFRVAAVVVAAAAAAVALLLSFCVTVRTHAKTGQKQEMNFISK